eukprot:365550-Chlamydomonas_euryale.AAC.7
MCGTRAHRLPARVQGVVQRIEADPSRSAFLALVRYERGAVCALMNSQHSVLRIGRGSPAAAALAAAVQHGHSKKEGDFNAKRNRNRSDGTDIYKSSTQAHQNNKQQSLMLGASSERTAVPKPFFACTCPTRACTCPTRERARATRARARAPHESVRVPHERMRRAPLVMQAPSARDAHTHTSACPAPLATPHASANQARPMHTHTRARTPVLHVFSRAHTEGALPLYRYHVAPRAHTHTHTHTRARAPVLRVFSRAHTEGALP